MKVKLVVRAAQKNGYMVLKELNAAGRELVNRIFKKKKEMEEKNNHEYFLHIVLDLRYQARTFKQNSSVWALVTAIFESMEGRLPDEEEKYCLYLDLLEAYADKIPSRFGGLRPVHISESNSVEGARFIDGLIHHLSTNCEFNTYDYLSVADALERFYEWRGGLEVDPLDYADIIGEAWNWVALLHDEHIEQHRIGWDKFLNAYPHLRGRVDKARRLAHKFDLDFKRDQRLIEYRPENITEVK
jgi:hypothetical protein